MHRVASFVLAGLFASCFTTATALAPLYDAGDPTRAKRVDFLTMLLGDSRKLFAQHFFLKADAYFHSGYYPSIFDTKGAGEASGEVHLVAAQTSDISASERKEDPASPSPPVAKSSHEGHDHGHEHDHDHGHDHSHDHSHDHGDELNFLGQASNWIDGFGRNFFPSGHSHLDGRTGQEEILPWLRLAAELDPNKVEIYTVASFWLRTQLRKPNEAVQFLREGLLLNPDAYPILCELGKVFAENLKHPVRARHVLEAALSKWHKVEGSKKEPDLFGLQQILTALVRLDESENRWEEGVKHLQLLKGVSPNPDKVEALIQDFRAKRAAKEPGR